MSIDVVIPFANLNHAKSGSSYDLELMKLLMAHAEQLARMLEIESANLFAAKTGVLIAQNRMGLFNAEKNVGPVNGDIIPLRTNSNSK